MRQTQKALIFTMLFYSWSCTNNGEEPLEQAVARTPVTMNPPQQQHTSAYHLVIQNVRSDEEVTHRGRHTLRIGESYTISLRTDGKGQAQPTERHYVYVFSVDSNGNSLVLFPKPGRSNSLTALLRGFDDHDQQGKAAPIRLGLPFGIGPPAGVRTFVLLITKVPIPNPDVLQRLPGRTVIEEEKQNHEKDAVPIFLQELRGTLQSAPQVEAVPTIAIELLPVQIKYPPK